MSRPPAKQHFSASLLQEAIKAHESLPKDEGRQQAVVTELNRPAKPTEIEPAIEQVIGILASARQNTFLFEAAGRAAIERTVQLRTEDLEIPYLEQIEAIAEGTAIATEAGRLLANRISDETFDAPRRPEGSAKSNGPAPH